mmetsp:Transcript_1285/g.2390  ORF Transcript_1285/g.2390 Transcript_1285/m.2390 type:complete len:244 (+) Transcript_1285:891-1622(+)
MPQTFGSLSRGGGMKGAFHIHMLATRAPTTKGTATVTWMIGKTCRTSITDMIGKTRRTSITATMGRNEGRNGGRNERMNEGGNERRNEGRDERRNGGRDGGRNEGSRWTMLRIMRITKTRMQNQPQQHIMNTKKPLPPLPHSRKQPPLKKPIPHSRNRPTKAQQMATTPLMSRQSVKRTAAPHPLQEAFKETALITLKPTTALTMIRQSQHLCTRPLTTQKRSHRKALMAQLPTMPAVTAATL